MMIGLLALLGLLLPGCAGSQGFDRHAMQSIILEQETLGSQGSEKATMPAGRALSVPFRLALFFVHRELPTRHTMRKADWVDADKQAVINALASLKEEQIVGDLFLLEDVTIRGRDASAIRRAARRYNADVVLIVDGVGAVDRYNNRSSWLYLTLAGAYLASGTQSDALFMINGSLWDVADGRLRATQPAEGSSQQVGPAMSVDDEAVFRRAKRAALDEFGKQVTQQLRRMGRPNDGLR